MYKDLEYSLTLSGFGETQEEAFNKIFSQIKPQIAKEIKELVVRIEPKDVAVISAKEKSYTERLFGVFFPRTRKRFELEVLVTVNLGLLDLSKVHFEQEQEQSNVLQKVLRFGQ